MHTKALAVSLLSLAALGGCASKPAMVKLGGGTVEARDNYECTREVEMLLPLPAIVPQGWAAVGYGIGRNRRFNALYRQCMEARGYSVSD